MATTLKSPLILKGNAHISNYKKSLSTTYSKKGIWMYLSKQRALLLKKMKK
jgi:hypothetical protein